MRRSDARLVELLAAGSTITTAAKLAGVSRRTVSRRLADPSFRQQVNAARGRMVDAASGRMAMSMASAATTLRKLLRSTSDAVRLQTARAILELGVKLRDATEINERISKLEEAVNGQQPSWQRQTKTAWRN